MISLDTGRAVVARVTDRGPYHSGRIVDLSLGAARRIGLTGGGARQVHLRAVGAPSAIRPRLADLRRQAGWRPPRRDDNAPTPPGTGPFYLQVASFGSRLRANSLARTLALDVARAGNLYRVRSRAYATATGAFAALAPLAAKGYPEVAIVR